VVASAPSAGADPPPCGGWQDAAERTDAETIQSFSAYCEGGRLPPVYAFKQGFPVKWQGASINR
jgi:hypothetical protein